MFSSSVLATTCTTHWIVISLRQTRCASPFSIERRHSSSMRSLAVAQLRVELGEALVDLLGTALTVRTGGAHGWSVSSRVRMGF